MKKWHETLAANIGLRALGITLFGIGWLLALRLHHMAQTSVPRDPGALMILLSAAIFLCASAGSALLFVGPGLWEGVEVSVRWRRVPPRLQPNLSKGLDGSGSIADAAVRPV